MSNEHNNFSHRWNFEPDTLNSFGEILFEKPQNLQSMTYELINVLPSSNFAVFAASFFVIKKSWNLLKLFKLTSYRKIPKI